MTPKKPEVTADARFEHPPNREGSRFHGDMTIVRSAHGITAVRQRVCVSNDIAVHALEVDVDVQSGPAWAQVASESHARLSIVAEALSQTVCSRSQRYTVGIVPPSMTISLP